MPFKLKVGKRTGRYELTRDLFVIQIQLIEEGHVLQCTLSSLSTGQDCLDYVCQRLELSQGNYFGLKYKSEQEWLKWRWVEMDKPLRKQMDRYSSDEKLYFAVLYHTPRANSLTDPVARHYYYLQMKSDILEGRLLVAPEKAILLASYSLQVDLGDHDEVSHHPDVLKGYSLLPKHMTKSLQILEDLVRQVTLAHRSLRGMAPVQAQLLYMTEAQLCEGYGQDYFQAKETDGTDVFIGYCQDGIVVKKVEKFHGVPLKTDWQYINSIVAHKRNISVNMKNLTNIHYIMEDAETAKYAAMVCQWQLNFLKDFYARNPMSLQNNQNAAPSFQIKTPPDIVPMNSSYNQSENDINGQFSGEMRQNLDYSNGSRTPLNESSDMLNYGVEVYNQSMENRLSYSTPHLYRVEPVDLTSQDDALPSYRAAPDYDTALQQPTIDEQTFRMYKHRLAQCSSLATDNVACPAESFEVSNSNPELLSDAPTRQMEFMQIESFEQVAIKCASSPDLVTVSLAMPSASNHTVLLPTVISVNGTENHTRHGQTCKEDSEMGACGPLLCAANIQHRPDLLISNQCADVSNDQRLAEMEALIEQESCLLGEFESIPKIRVSAGLSTAQLNENRRLNRNTTVLPYEDTRVMLRPNKHNPSGYINASVIQVPLGNITMKYIATQAPLKETQNDFWQMVWESGARVVVMLTKCKENSEVCSEQYWPQENGEKMRHGDYHITLISGSRVTTHKTCTLSVKHAPSGQKRNVYHLQYLEWQKGHIPNNIDHFLSFLDEVSSVKRHVLNDINNPTNQRRSVLDSSGSSSGSSWRSNKPSGLQLVIQAVTKDRNEINHEK